MGTRAQAHHLQHLPLCAGKAPGNGCQAGSVPQTDELARAVKAWIIKHPGAWDGLFAFLRQIDLSKPIEVRWGPPRRTNKQNAYLWGVVYERLAAGMSEYYNAHITADHMHELCK